MPKNKYKTQSKRRPRYRRRQRINNGPPFNIAEALMEVGFSRIENLVYRLITRLEKVVEPRMNWNKKTESAKKGTAVNARRR